MPSSAAVELVDRGSSPHTPRSSAKKGKTDLSSPSLPAPPGDDGKPFEGVAIAAAEKEPQPQRRRSGAAVPGVFREIRGCRVLDGNYVLGGMRPPRWIPDNSLIELCVRCFQGRFLLKPSPELNDIIIGVLGRALALYPATVHAAAFLSNHYHLLATVPSTRLMSQFLAYLNRNLSIEVGKLHGWKGPMWERRYQHSIVDNDPLIQVERLKYILSQGVKEGLVATPYNWPWVHAAEPLACGAALVGTWVHRSKIWAAKNRREAFDPAKHTEQYEVTFAPIPCWAHLERAEVQRRVRGLVDQIVHEAARDRKTEAPGAEFVVRRHPHHRPKRVKWSPAPRYMLRTGRRDGVFYGRFMGSSRATGRPQQPLLEEDRPALRKGRFRPGGLTFQALLIWLSRSRVTSRRPGVSRLSVGEVELRPGRWVTA